MASMYDSSGIGIGNGKDDPDVKKAQELRFQRRVIFGITPSDEDRFDSNLGAEISEGLKRKLMEVIDFSNNTDFAKRKMKDHIAKKAALSQAENTNKKLGNQSQKPLTQRIIIPLEGKFTSMAQLVMSILAAYSVFTNVFQQDLYNDKQHAFSIAFGYPDQRGLKGFDIFIEILFLLDIFRNFLTEYQDPQTVQMVGDLKLIGKNYIMKSSFVFDVFAVFPFIYVIDWSYCQDLLLIKMLRLYKLQVKFIEADQILKMMRFFYQNKDREDIIQYDNLLKQIIKVFGLIINTCVITYVLGCFWYRMVDRIDLGDDMPTFITQFFKSKVEGEELSDGIKLVYSVYFILTTLSTVGYGDFYPISILEKIVGSLIMFCGVTFFSIIMNEFIGIILELKGDNQTDDEKDLNKWMTLLRRFNHGGKALDFQIREDISKHFNYYWANNRTATLLEKKDYFDALPRDIKRQLMKEYLYEDVFTQYRFKDFFDNGEQMDPDFLYDISFGFQPRQFWPTGEDRFIYESFEYITEMYFVMKGKWSFAKEVFNVEELQNDSITRDKIVKYNGKNYLILKEHTTPTYIGEYYIFTSQMSRYNYIARENVETFSLTQQFMFDHIFSKYPQLKTEMIAEAHNRYTTKFQRPLTKAWKDLTEKVQIQVQDDKAVTRPPVIDLTKAAEKKEKVASLNQQLEMNKLKLENLNEKASHMFKHIEEIQTLILQKCEDFEEHMHEAEDTFKHNLNIAIRENKKLKRELRDNFKSNLKGNLINMNIGDKFKNRKPGNGPDASSTLTVNGPNNRLIQ
eukprot:403371524